MGRLYHEIVQIRLDGSGATRWLHHRSRPVDSYNWQPKLSASRDGTRLVFASNFNLSLISGNHSEYRDAHVLIVSTACAAPSISGVVNAASYARGPLTANSYAALFGIHLGCGWQSVHRSSGICLGGTVVFPDSGWARVRGRDAHSDGWRPGRHHRSIDCELRSRLVQRRWKRLWCSRGTGGHGGRQWHHELQARRTMRSCCLPGGNCTACRRNVGLSGSLWHRRARRQERDREYLREYWPFPGDARNSAVNQDENKPE